MEEMPVEKNTGRESRHCYLEVKVLKEVQEYQDNAHLMCYTHKTWTDGTVTFRKCGKKVKSWAFIFM